MGKIELTTIGTFHCNEKYRYETARQGIYANKNKGIITLNRHQNFELALRDLSGFDRIWVIYQLHLNSTWKPIVNPPVVGNQKKISLFATRSPHRPNPIGMSCIELEKVEGLNLFVKNFDLLDGTPILDIKPYIITSDSFPDSKQGWLPLEKREKDQYLCSFSDKAVKQMDWIYNSLDLNLIEFSKLQLSYQPLNKKRKRVKKIDSKQNEYILACRTWRIHFNIDEANKKLAILEIKSGYNASDLMVGSDDKYNDKDYHRKFNKICFV